MEKIKKAIELTGKRRFANIAGISRPTLNAYLSGRKTRMGTTEKIMAATERVLSFSRAAVKLIK